MNNLKNIPATKLRETSLPLRVVRRHTVDYMELLHSIQDVGILQPLLVRPQNNHYEIIEGGWRFSAGLAAGLKTFPCLVQPMEDKEVLRVQVQANAVRPLTRPIEFSNRLTKLLEDGMSFPELVRLVHKSPGWLRRMLSLTNLHGSVKVYVNRGEICLKAAAELARLPNHMQADFLQQALAMPTDDFIAMVRLQLKNYKEALQTGNLENYVYRHTEVYPYWRSMREIRSEAAKPTAAGPVVYRMGAKTVLDGWRAALAWVLHLDPHSIENQEQTRRRKAHEKLTNIERRKADRDLRQHLSTLKDSQ